MIALVAIAALIVGALAGVGAHVLLARWGRLRVARLRCGWCGRVRPSMTGQACAECLASLNGPNGVAGSVEGFASGRAAPADWPEA